MSNSRTHNSKELVDKIRGAYDKVKVFPESRPDGFMDLIALRNLIGEWLEVTAPETCEWHCGHCGRANASTVTLTVTHCGQCERIKQPAQKAGEDPKSLEHLTL